jgi:hypothetical protein
LIERVFQQPASTRAALLGLLNVGSGVIRAPGLIEVHDGLVTETLDRSIRFEPGRRSFAAVVDSVELRNGGRFVGINGVQFDVAIEDAAECSFSLDPSGVSAWICEPRRGDWLNSSDAPGSTAKDSSFAACDKKERPFAAICRPSETGRQAPVTSPENSHPSRPHGRDHLVATHHANATPRRFPKATLL